MLLLLYKKRLKRECWLTIVSHRRFKRSGFCFLYPGFLALNYNTCFFVALRNVNLGGKWSV